MSIGSPGARALLAVLVLAWPFAPASAHSLEEANAQANRFVERTMREQRIPGLQVAVVKDGRIVLSRAYGMANVEDAVPATASTRFPLNSATKAFTGVAIMQLAHAGRVDLQASVCDYVDGLPQAWCKVRVRQLLAHTSGLPDILDEQGLIGGGTEQAAWTAVTRLPVQAGPGERFVYNQTNYVLLGRIIAQLAGIPYEEYLARQQFAPAGMRSAAFADSYDLLANSATMYSYLPRRTDDPDRPARLSRWFYDVPENLRAGSGLQATAGDVARWLVALHDGRLLPADELRAMGVPEKLNSGADGSWAAGWPILGDAPGKPLAATGGARAAFFVYPDDGLAIVVLTNLVGANPQEFIPQIAAFYRD